MIMEQKLTQDDWLSEIMDRQVYSVPAQLPSSDILKSISAVLSAAPSNEKVFFYAKTAADDRERAELLTCNGFTLIDTLLTFEKVREPLKPAPARNVRAAAPLDENPVCDLAGKCFSQSRFHRDSRIGNLLANKIKTEWARGFFKKSRGIGMLVAVDEQGKPLGFLLLLRDKEGRLIIDLIGVDRAHSGKGLGTAMIQAAFDEYPQASVLRVGTQLANKGSIRFYEKLGFRFCEAQHVFHRHGAREVRP